MRGVFFISIGFYRVRDPYGCFSNFSRHGFYLDDKYWPTVEHYFQAQKFAGTIYEDPIRLASTPLIAATMGRDHSKPLRSDWDDAKYDIMKRAVLKKFETHIELKNMLLSTENQKIIEETTDDFFWGCGKDGTGENALGRILMQVREILKKELNG